MAQIADGLNRGRPICYRIPSKSVFYASRRFDLRAVAFEHTQFLRVNIKKPTSGLVETEETATASQGDAVVLAYSPLRAKVPVCTNTEWESVGPVVREMVLALPFVSASSTRHAMTFATRFCLWAHRQHFPLEATLLLSFQVIEAFTASVGKSASTYRSFLRRLAAANDLGEFGEMQSGTPEKYEGTTLLSPYTRQEIASILFFASSLSNEVRRDKIQGLVLLAAGCGFLGRDFYGVSKDHLHHHDQMLFIRTHDRCAMVLPEYEDALLDFASKRSEPCLVDMANIRELPQQCARWTANRVGVPQARSYRLRNTYVVSLLNARMSLRDVLLSSGISTLDGLNAYLPFLEAPSETCIDEGWSH